MMAPIHRSQKTADRPRTVIRRKAEKTQTGFKPGRRFFQIKNYGLAGVWNNQSTFMFSQIGEFPAGKIGIDSMEALDFAHKFSSD